MNGARGAGATRGALDGANEDEYVVSDELALYAVCDGFRDGPGGEIAAHLAIEAIEHFLDRRSDSASDPPSALQLEGSDAREAVRYAIGAIADAVELRPDLAGMETTITLMLVDGGHAFIAHRGDSRAYLIRNDQVAQLTTDHKWTEVDDSVESTQMVDAFDVEISRGDTFILCTDGAERELSNRDLLDGIGGYSPRLIASRLVSAAHRHDPSVDATVVVVRIRDTPESLWSIASPNPDSEGQVSALSLGRREPHDEDRRQIPSWLRRDGKVVSRPGRVLTT